ncbi:GNAT family N-acetyltransferase [Metabacillus sp. GX 13764]|uniref:GNAT family N-acetyltransferase n=1 Tax=Metabacillus kandeliae TaxID=2900151 RepID=UPI001E3EEB36|nr:GNAT family protein [Metabacillus kandeliae]MCD7033250.1 GNAT family N-acetyltransferase [Metabacillus kandeliae]
MESNFIKLREFQEQDWQEVHRYASNPVVSQYQPWGPNTEEETKAFIADCLTDQETFPRKRCVFAITSQEKVIGAGEFQINDFTNEEGEIGFVVHPDYWGKGIASETAKKLLQFGFCEFQMHRIFATCDPRNLASARVLKKAGMKQEGLLRENIKLKSGWRDSLIFSMLKKEWEASEDFKKQQGF